MAAPVRALSRGLTILETLNRRNGASLNWLAKTTGLSRGTVFRMLETFRGEGYVEKDEGTHLYWLMERVQGLSDGYEEAGWLSTIARPRLEALGREVAWPLSICVPSGISMIVKLTTDLDNPLTMERIPPGLRMPMAGSAAGRAYLAFCSEDRRRTFLDLIVKTSTDPRDAIAREPDVFARLLAGIRETGWSTLEGTHRVSNLAVPVIGREGVFAAVVLRVFTSAMTLDTAASRYGDALGRCARDIAAAFDAAKPRGGTA